MTPRASDARLVLLHLLARHARIVPPPPSQSADTVQFYAELVVQRSSPALAYCAACCLLAHCAAAQTSAFRAALARLLARRDAVRGERRARAHAPLASDAARHLVSQSLFNDPYRLARELLAPK